MLMNAVSIHGRFAFFITTPPLKLYGVQQWALIFL